MLYQNKLSKGRQTNKFYKLYFLLPLFITLFFLTFSPLFFKFPPQKQVRISISQIIDHPALNESRRGIVDGLKAARYIPGKNLILDIEFARGKPTLAMQIAQKFVGEDPDVVVGLGTTSSQSLAFAAKGKSIPVIFASVTDPLEAKLVYSVEKPGRLVTGVSNFTKLKPQFELFKKLIPNLKNLGIVYNPGEANSQTMMKKAIEAAKIMGINIIPSPALKTAEVSSATRQLMGKVEAIFINNDNTALAAFETVVKVANGRKIPVFSSDTDLVERGALASLGPKQYELGLQTAKLIIRILKGENASEIPVQYAENLETKINQEVAKKLGVYL